jgi:protein-L-isoaspartate(D-aspartate) O-methyltransferase
MRLEDLYRHKGMRKQMVEGLKELGINAQEVLDAMEQVPRHLFLDQAFEKFAYENKAFQIGAGQTISQPYTVAFQSSLLMPLKGLKVLEIGTGSGYQSAVLCALGAKVFSIERQRALYDKTRVLLPALGYSPKMMYGDGYKGWPVFAPFDRIIVTAAAPYIPEDLLKQLKPGGIMVIPVGEVSGAQRMLSIIRTMESPGEFKTKEHGEFRFVPMLGEKEWGDLQ